MKEEEDMIIECCVEDLIALINGKSGEFVIDVEIEEEGEVDCGKVGAGIDQTGKRSATMVIKKNPNRG